MHSGNSRNDTQCISRPFTPEKGQHNIRGAFGRFEKTPKMKKTTGESLSKKLQNLVSQAKTELRIRL